MQAHIYTFTEMHKYTHTLIYSYLTVCVRLATPVMFAGFKPLLLRSKQSHMLKTAAFTHCTYTQQYVARQSSGCWYSHLSRVSTRSVLLYSLYVWMAFCEHCAPWRPLTICRFNFSARSLSKHDITSPLSLSIPLLPVCPTVTSMWRHNDAIQS